MSIPASNIVNVTITTTPSFPSRMDFGLLNIVGMAEVISLGERVRLYSTIDEVAADFASTDQEYIAATVFFSQNPRPSQLMISRRADVDYAAELRGGLAATQVLATWLAISDGEFTVSIDGVTEDIDNTIGLDFSAVTSMDDVAAEVQVGLQAIAAGGFTAATCTWNDDRFIIKSGTTGATSTITVLTDVTGGTGTSIKELLDMGTNGIAIAGVDQETITESLDAIRLINDSWYGLAFTKEVNDVEAQVVMAADWCEARIKLFVNGSTDANVKDALSTTDIAYVLEAAEYRRTFSMVSFSTEYYIAVSAFARLAVVNFSGTDTTITMKFKTLPTITADDLNTNDASVISGKNCNYYATFGIDSSMVAEGVCADGSFIDSVHGVDWLQNAIETNVFGRLYTEATKVPLTDKGATQLAEQVRNALDEGVTNGLIAPGTTASGTYLSQGYIVETQKVADMSASERAARQGPLIQFTAIGAGAIHSIEIQGVFEG